ncbi:putative FAD dependent oxidoreductase [Usnea florida]
MTGSSEKRNIVIIGGGIIGCTSAYFLTRHPSYDPSKHKITLLEASKIAGGASGKAGGLLALWAYPSSIVPLSYKLHEELAASHHGEGRWGYRKIHSGSLTARGRTTDQVPNLNASHTTEDSVSLQKLKDKASRTMAAAGIPKDLDWVAPDSARSYYEMGTPNDTAQVHPYQFTTAIAQLAENAGAEIILGSVTSIDKTGGAVKSVTYTDKETSESHTLPATDVIISAGPWTRNIYPPAPISALRAHSVTIRPSKPISAYALFTDISLPPNFGRTDTFQKSKGAHSKQVTPEIYARPNNEAYACGEGDTLVPLPKTSADVVTDDSRCQDIIDYVSSISDELRDGEVLVRQACYLPNVQATSGGPLIGETGVKGLLMAAGHTCWGIQNGPGTGKLISEFVFDGKAKSANISSLDPRKVL